MYYKISDNFTQLTEQIKDIKSYFNDSKHSIHKARNELRVTKIDNVDVVIKSFKVPHLLNQIVYSFFRDSKAEKSYEYSLRLQALNISTPEPIAYIEFYRFGLLKESYFINRHIEYDFTIREVFNDPDFKDHDKILEEFAKFTYDLHQKGVLHLDYSPGNILIKKVDNEYQFYLVDINRMKFQELDPIERFKNFSKLWAHTEDLTIIAKSYAEISGYNKVETIKQIFRYNNNNKRIKNFKKRFKNYKA